MQMKSRREAFTLVEILVVIAIIAILASLAAWGVFSMIGSTQRNNTNATIRLLNKLMQQRWDAVIADSRREPPSKAVLDLAKSYPFAPDMDPTNERAKVIWAKVRLAEAFPVGYGEMASITVNPNTIVNKYIPLNRRKGHFAKYEAIVQGKTPGQPGESAACLLMALRTLQADGVPLDDQIKHAIADHDGTPQNPSPNQIPTLVDGWKMPLAFFRFSWNNAALQKANPALLNVNNLTGKKFSDPIDPKGSLLTTQAGTQQGWYSLTVPPPNVPPRVTYETMLLPQSANPPIAGGSPIRTAAGDAYYVAPVIVSAGKDQMMTLLPDLSVGGPADNDNILSFQLRGE